MASPLFDPSDLVCQLLYQLCWLRFRNGHTLRRLKPCDHKAPSQTE